MSRLSELLRQIDPRNSVDEFSKVADRAINSYDYSSVTIESVDDLFEELGRFYWHLESAFLGIGSGFNPDSGFNRSLCEKILQQSFGSNYRTSVLNMARTGVGGGLLEIYRKIGEAMAHKWADQKIEYEVTNFQNEAMSDFGLFERSVEEYAEDYGHLLPGHMLEKDNCDLKIEFFQVLRNHPHMIKRMREIGKA